MVCLINAHLMHTHYTIVPYVYMYIYLQLTSLQGGWQNALWQCYSAGIPNTNHSSASSLSRFEVAAARDEWRLSMPQPSLEKLRLPGSTAPRWHSWWCWTAGASHRSLYTPVLSQAATSHWSLVREQWNTHAQEWKTNVTLHAYKRIVRHTVSFFLIPPPPPHTHTCMPLAHIPLFPWTRATTPFAVKLALIALKRV